MAVQFPQQDRRPDLVFAGYQALGAGISGGVRSLSDALEKRQDEAKRLNAAGKAAKAFLKATGEDPMETEAMSFRDAIGKMAGMNAESHYKAGAADTQEKFERALALKTQREGAARQPAFLAELERYNEPGQLPYDIPEQDFERYALPEGQTQPDLREFTAAASRTQYPLDFSKIDLLRAMEAQGGGDEGPFEFVEDPVSGSRFARSRKSVLPSGTNPDKVISTEEVELADGEVVTVIRTGKGTQIIRKRAPQGEVTEAAKLRSLTERYSAIVRTRRTLTASQRAEADGLLEEINALIHPGTQRAAPAESAATELPKPTTKAAYDSLPSGTRYIHPTGETRVKK